MAKCEFSLDHYRRILTKAKKEGYSFESFKDSAIPKDARCIFLRHDVDGSPAAALEIAEIEADLSVRSNFFFMPDCPTYRLDSPITINTIESISKMGHWIGRHLTKVVYTEFMVYPFTILEYSVHRPGEKHLGAKTLPRSTYDPRFFSDIKYISDSGGMWRDGCACKHLNGQQLQILVHPEWWIGDTRLVLNKELKTMAEDAKSYIKDVFPGVYDAQP